MGVDALDWEFPARFIIAYPQISKVIKRTGVLYNFSSSEEYTKYAVLVYLHTFLIEIGNNRRCIERSRESRYAS